MRMAAGRIEGEVLKPVTAVTLLDINDVTGYITGYMPVTGGYTAWGEHENQLIEGSAETGRMFVE